MCDIHKLKIENFIRTESLCIKAHRKDQANVIYNIRQLQSNWNKTNLRNLIAATGLVILLKIDPNHHFSANMTSKFDRCPQIIIGHLVYTTSSFVHHFKSIGELQLKLQSGNPQFGSKFAIFLSRMTLKFDGWPWKTIGHLFYTTLSSVHHFKIMGEFELQLQSENSRFGSKSANFCPVLPWNLTDDLEKQYGTSFILLQALCFIS